MCAWRLWTMAEVGRHWLRNLKNMVCSLNPKLLSGTRSCFLAVGKLGPHTTPCHYSTRISMVYWCQFQLFNFTFQNWFKRKSLTVYSLWENCFWLFLIVKAHDVLGGHALKKQGFSGKTSVGPSQESHQRGAAGNRLVPHSWLSWFGTPRTMVYIYHDKSIVNGIITYYNSCLTVGAPAWICVPIPKRQ